ncbi:MAG TPA: TraR/DksA C4-type zinc finger protein [Micrococcaceae bacterium]|nr:TraR/DksA C4-type zinc finger protein [Micrococcaceae bacterium]
MQGRGAVPQLTDRQLALLEQVLEERTARAQLQVGRLSAEIRDVTLAQRDTPADDEHDPEGSTVSVERERDVALLGSAEHQLSELLAARSRLEAGSLGVCERCGGPVPFERLQARPEVRFCVPCVERLRQTH